MDTQNFILALNHSMAVIESELRRLEDMKIQFLEAENKKLAEEIEKYRNKQK